MKTSLLCALAIVASSALTGCIVVPGRPAYVAPAPVVVGPPAVYIEGGGYYGYGHRHHGYYGDGGWRR